MVHPTLLAIAFVAVWIDLFLRHDDYRPMRMWVQQALRSAELRLRQWARDVYIQYRSEISLLIGRLLCFSTPFVCDCCYLSLGRQDLDVPYHANCQCDANATSTYCYHCICTYVQSQVTDQQATRPVCMATRQCILDDRLVRKRLSSAAVLILDRHPIIAASRDVARTSQSNVSEKLWHCPSPDCSYMGYISTTTTRQPERLGLWQSLGRFVSMTASKPDPRSVRCPSCLIASCQFCKNVWTRGTADHARISCDAYATLLASASTTSTHMLDTWKVLAGVQSCRQCHATIEKNNGCKHMTCRCGYEFCWTCGVEWTNRHMIVSCRPIAPTPREQPVANDADTPVQRFMTWMTSWI